MKNLNPPVLSLSSCRGAFFPTTFLDYLETHLGLLTPPVSRLERTTGLLAELREHPSDYPSFRDSFAVAPLAVAQCLLDWLDTLALHGWNGQAGDHAPPRVKELALLTHRLSPLPGLSTGQRLNKVQAALNQGFVFPLDSLSLADDLDDWPWAWQKVLKQFTLSAVPYGPQAPKDTDLGMLQATFQAGSVQIPKEGLPWKGDATIQLVGYDSALSSALWLSRNTTHLDCSDCYIVQGGGSLWDESSRGNGTPEAGARELDAYSPVDQLLPLALRLYREPLDLEALMAFLTHPQCPLEVWPKPLAKALAEEPGIRGDKWDEAIAKLEEQNSNARVLVSQWLPESRYNQAGLPRTVAVEITERLARRVPLSSGQTSLFQRVLTLLGHGFELISWPLLEELATLSSSSSGENPLNQEGAASPNWTSDPGAIIEPCRNLTWFAPSRPVAVDPWPWSDSEIKALKEQGCCLPEMARLGSRTLRMVWRAVSQVQRKLVVVVPSDDRNPSPLAVALKTFWPKLPISSLEKAMLNRDGDALLTALPLPAVRRWWELPLDLASRAASLSSQTQLETFLQSPARWFLERQAKIQPGTILQLKNASAIQGSFSHWVIEQLFLTFGDKALELDDDSFTPWFQTTFDRGLQRMAATFLEPGRGQERLRFRSWLARSIRSLCRALKQAGAHNVRMETKLEGLVFGGYFHGYADILFEGPQGTLGIVDMKSSKSRASYTKKLSTDTDIQLTLYAELIQQTQGVLPEAAYWLLPLELLAARNTNYFPGSQIPSSGTPHPNRLRMIETSVDWRRDQLAQGKIEVVCEATKDLGDPSLAPPGGLPWAEPNDRFDSNTNLYGWESQS